MAGASKDFKRLWKGLWESVCPYVSNAVVFLDNASAEILHWSFGARKLLDAGATNIKEFSSFEVGAPSDKYAVFIVNDLLADTTEDIISDIISSSHFDYCTVITTFSHLLHKHLLTKSSDEQQVGQDFDRNVFFKDFEKKMIVWMNKKPSSHAAEVIHIPLTVASINSSLFFLPAFQKLFPLLNCDLKRMTKRDVQGQNPSAPVELSLNHLPQDLQKTIKKLVSTLSSMCEDLHVNEDVYCVGSMSRIIATELAGLQSARARRKAAQHRASLILIDRTLDLVGPAGHSQDSFLDKVLSTLPSLPGHMTEVTVDMTDLYGLKTIPGQQIFVPGCLSHPSSPEAEELISKMMVEKKKMEVLRAVNRQLVDTISKARLSDPASLAKVDRISVESLKAHLKVFKNNSNALMEHSDKLQVTSACIQTLTNDRLKRHEALADEEKLLMQRLGYNLDDEVWKQIHSFLSKEASEESHGYSVEEVLERLVFMSSLSGIDLTWSSMDKENIKSNLTKIFMRNAEKSTLISNLTNDNLTEESIGRGVDSVIMKLESIGKSRENLQKLSSLLEIGSSEKPSSYTPLLHQLFTQIFDPNKPELIDVEYKSSGLRDLLKSGFSYFMTVSKPRPNDHSLVIVFVVGGVTCSEVKMIRDVVGAKSSETQVVVGSTQVLKHSNLLETLFSMEHLNP